ncbi:MAG: hypothetical protein PHU56_02370 [Candidatus Pacebacteria bacterium]|nr:hypothetical protein [Candidatus Paceibacterota bacterium]
MPEKTKIFIVSALIACLGIFFVTTIRSGHGWGDDFALYIHHAINMVQGIAYGDTGYVYNPAVPSAGPATYPPVFPLMLTPVYKMAGLDFTAFKIENILCFLLALFLVYFVLRKELSFKYLLALLVLMGLHPFFWRFKESVVSDFPFLFFAFLSLFLIARAPYSDSSGKKQLFYGFLTGLCFYLAYGTRVIGIVLPATLVCYQLVKTKKITRATVIASAVFLFLAVLQAFLLPKVGRYFDQFADLSVRSVIKSFLISAKSLIFFWGDYPQALSLGFAVALLALLGFIVRLKKKGLSSLEIFLIFYVLVIGIWPSNQGTRFLIPIIPLFLFYCFYFLQETAVLLWPPARRISGAVFVLILLAASLIYADFYISADFGPIEEGPFKKESIELFEFVGQNTRPDDVFIFNKPLALSLFASRHVSAFHETETDQEFRQYLDKVSADYLIQRKGAVVKYNSNFLDGFISRNQAWLGPVYSNADFAVYKILPKAI